ncbi:Kazal-type serine protease inhibitor domain-containing protein 1, partial [Stegodyphus mimosarum]
MYFNLLILAIAFIQVRSELNDKCGECEPEKCKPPAEECLAGLVRDLCGCCYVCGRQEGELCDGDLLPIPYRNRGHGPCGEHLECRPRTDLAPGDLPEALCVCIKTEALCGNDGVTYENECQLTEARYRYRNGLQAAHRGPCKSAPKIVSPPEDVANYTGGHVALSCEAMGWPIPVVEWRVDKGNGDTEPLPSDDPKVAVQSRGGPSRYEVTSWLQFLNINPENQATYWCIAKNELGESSASATVKVTNLKGDHALGAERLNDL